MSKFSYNIHTKRNPNVWMYLSDKNVVLEDCSNRETSVGYNHVQCLTMAKIDQGELFKNSCKFAEKWNIVINKNRNIPFMDLSQC